MLLHIIDAWPFRVAGCDTDHYLVVWGVNGELWTSKQATQKKFNVKVYDNIKLIYEISLQCWKN
jgi:hypothetical protein